MEDNAVINVINENLMWLFDTSSPVTSAMEKESMSEQDETEADVVPKARVTEHGRGTGDATNTRVLRPREKLKQPSKFKS